MEIIELFYFLFPAVSGQAETSGPVFVEEPPVQVDFSNTTGTEVVCQSRGTPMPKIQWVRASDGEVVRDVPGLRQVRQKNQINCVPWSLIEKFKLKNGD